jgi:hypothetical protein
MRERLTKWSIASFICAIAAGTLWVVLPMTGWLTPPSAQFLAYVCGFFILISIALFVWEFRKSSNKDIEALYSQTANIVGVLQQIEDCLWKFADQVKDKKLTVKNLQDLNEANNEINKNIIGVEPNPANSIQGLQDSFNAGERQIYNKYYKNTKNDIKVRFKKALPVLHSESLFLDSRGLGLKQQKSHNGVYRELTESLRNYRKYIYDSTLNELIKMHIEGAETVVNLYLHIYRFTILKVKHEGQTYDVNKIVPTEIVVLLEGLNSELREIMFDIRTDISNRIRLLEKEDLTIKKS